MIHMPIRKKAGTAPAAESTDDDSSGSRTGYYIAGHDWPAITSTVEVLELYKALRGIDEEQVGSAGETLLTAGIPDGEPADGVDRW